MPAPRNPFPGLNPFFQDDWRDIHNSLLAFIASALSEILPPDLLVRVNERVQTVGNAKSDRADASVFDPWQQGLPPVWPAQEASASTVKMTEPLIYFVEPEPDRWLEIRNVKGSVITVIEVLSPANKNDEGASAYRQKQRDLLAGGVNLVEIDFIRGGQHVLAIPLDRLDPSPPSTRWICVARTHGDYQGRREVYPCPLRNPLPAIRVPLRSGDPDAPLALQPLIDQCYRAGRYWLSDYTREPTPPLLAEDAVWVQECLQAAGLR